MGIGIMIPGAHFTDERYIIGKVKIPEEPVPECEHAYDNDCDTICNLCGAVRTVPHNLVHVDAVAPTDAENGNVEYWHCTLCDGYWLDEACTQPTTAEDVVLLSVRSYPAYDTSLKGLYDLGVDETSSLTNRAPNATGTAVVTGTVEWKEEYGVFSGKGNASRVDTGIYPSISNGSITYVALFRVPTGSRPIVGKLNSSGGERYGLSWLNSCVHKCTDKTASTIDYDVAVNSDKFVVMAMTANTTGFKVWRYTGAGMESVHIYDGSIDSWGSTRQAMIGGEQTSNSYDDAHISLVAIHQGDMTDQLDSICKFVYDYGVQKHGEENIE